MKENEFYNGYYQKIKDTENEVLSEICKYLIQINEQSETKLVEHLTARIKTPESAMAKLNKKGFEPTVENAIGILSDVIGIRLVCHFIGDIYTLRNIFVDSTLFTVVKEKDYVLNPKPGGYRGYHIIIQTNYNNFPMKVEIQLRTIAMDCWASLEHQIRYKKNIKDSELINAELKRCADEMMSTDIAMEQIWNIVRNNSKSIVEKDEDFFQDALLLGQNNS